MTIDLPDPIYQNLLGRARLEHRTVSQQAMVMLAEALGAAPDPGERLKRLRERPLAGNIEAMEPPEKLIREDCGR